MITVDEAKKYNDRMMWDCRIDPFRSHIVELEGYSLESGLKWAMAEVGLPKLVILPWCLADVLLWHERQKFNDMDKHYASFEDYEKDRVLKSGPLLDRTWGYLGEYRGADVLATGNTDFAWVTCERDPAFIGGVNTFFLTVKR